MLFVQLLDYDFFFNACEFRLVSIFCSDYVRPSRTYNITAFANYTASVGK